MEKVQTIANLEAVLGTTNVLTELSKTEHYRNGWRSGQGDALAVVFPQTLLQYWQVLNVCVDANCIVVMQAANTGLTEGSTPSNDGYDREVVIINTLAMDKLYLLGNGEQAIGLPGTTLHKLESELKKIHRAPHSVIGSSGLGASIVGGIANNSGGALVKRGPAYTELSLYAKVDKFGRLNLVNHLGVELGDSPEQILTNLENGTFDKCHLKTDKQASSSSDYIEKIRQIDADSPSRFNADISRLYEASGCAGKLAVFAVLVDTFPVAKREQTFYLGTNQPATFTHLRRHILSKFKNLPEVGEYIHREMFDVAATYGKDTFLSIEHLGTAKLPTLFSIKGRVDALIKKVPLLPNNMTDRVMQTIGNLFPQHLPKRMLEFRAKYEHHLILKVSDDGIEEAQQFLADYFSSNSDVEGYFECNDEEARKAYLHRFAAAGAAIRYQTLNGRKLGDILALDIALKRNEECWFEQLPDHISKHIDKSLYYGHFFCHVLHQDYVLKAGADPTEVKAMMLRELDVRGAKYPAEHNVGHLYEAEEGLKRFYQELDPTNTFNPGIGKMDKGKRNCSCSGGLL